MNEELIIREAELDDIGTIGYLAYQVWPSAYKEILTLDQLQYMLNRIYSPASLRRQMIEEHHHFLLAELSGKPVGFASYGSLNLVNEYKLHKLYVRTEIQGKGLGKALLHQVIENCLSAGANRLLVNVNRHNNAISFYEKAGFKIIREEDVDIGNGYFMNDFVMEMQLES